MRCSRCSQLLCAICINKLSQGIKPIKNDIHSDYSSYVQSIICYSATGNTTDAVNYIGHCCLIEVKRNEEIDLEKKTKKKI